MANLLSYRAGSLQKPHLPFTRLAGMGIQGLELVWNEQTTVDAVRAAVEPAGLQVTSIHAPSPLDSSELPAILERHAECAAALGASYLFVSVHAGQMPRPEAYERLRHAGDAVGNHRIYLALETHPDLCQNGSQMAQTMAGINHPWVGINYDTANIYYYNEKVDTVEEVKKAARFVRGVHLKDTLGGFHDGNFPVFGEGVVDFAGVGGELAAVGYAGPLCMELEGGAFDPGKPDDLAAKVARCIAHLRSVGVVE
ncbi:MAG: sugar phosphate isomerase/epimerase family protein [Candidatus Latescibacterota bacterium]